jgi:N-acetylglucosamine-6-sulfatase
MLALAGVAVVAGCGIGGDDEAPAFDAGDPSFVVIQTDDATSELISPRAMPRAFKAVRERRGTVFTNYVTVTPLCCPSRATLLTGQYAHNHGVLSNDPGYPSLIEPDNTLPAWLERDGYSTVHLGKFLNESAGRAEGVRPDGWTQWETALEPNRYFEYKIQRDGPDGPKEEFGSDPEDYFTTRLNRVAVETIEQLAQDERPFYLEIDHEAPHKKEGVPGDACPAEGAPVPAPRDRDLVGSLPVRLSPAARERDLADKPPFIREQIAPLTDAERERVELNLQCAAAAMNEVDRGVRDVLEAIDEAGIADRTVVMLVNDNGFFFGEHGLVAGKTLPYEPALRSPMLAWIPPELAGGEPPKRIHQLTANLDLAPTFLELAGAEPCVDDGECRTIDGLSQVGLWRGEAGEAYRDRALVIEASGTARYASEPGRACEWTGVRTARETYVHYTRLPRTSDFRCVPVDEREYYDLRSDPNELENRIDDPDAAVRIAELEATVERLRECSGESCR